MESFSASFGLNQTWPVTSQDQTEMTPKGHIRWAEPYLLAAEELYLPEAASYDYYHFAGPVVQVMGLATELTLKCLLRGAGLDEKAMKKFGHNTYNAYFEARQFFDETKFIGLVFANTEHLELPGEVKERIESRADG